MLLVTFSLFSRLQCVTCGNCKRNPTEDLPLPLFRVGLHTKRPQIGRSRFSTEDSRVSADDFLTRSSSQKTWREAWASVLSTILSEPRYTLERNFLKETLPWGINLQFKNLVSEYFSVKDLYRGLLSDITPYQII